MRTRPLIAVVASVLLAAPVLAQNAPDYTLTETAVEIAPGTTMFELVRDYYPNHRNDWLRVAGDLADANPEAFRNGDPGALIVGKTILLIDYGDGIATATDDDDAASDQAAAPAAADAVAVDGATDNTTNGAAPDAPAPATAAPTLSSIAKITRLRGAPVAIDRNNRQRTLKANAELYRGDTLLTGADEPLSLVMQDGAVIRVRANTRLMFEKYVSKPAAGDRRGSVMTLSAGGLRLTTGDLATLTSTGGDLAIALCDDGTCQASGDAPSATPGLYAGVALGDVSVSNNTGTATAARGEVLRVRTADMTPQLASDQLGVVFNTSELLALDLQPDEPMGFFAWFRQRFFSFAPSPKAGASDEALQQEEPSQDGQ